MPTNIEWVINPDGTKGETWNPVTGCTKISAGCKNCYAERMSKRLAGRFGYPKNDPFKVTLHQNRLKEPLKWRKPRTVFVCSMSDLFHEDVPFDFIDQVFEQIENMDHHTYQILTKRPKRVIDYVRYCQVQNVLPEIPANVWLGVSVENQEQADKRIPILLQTPAKVRFVSLEPLLGAIKLHRGHEYCLIHDFDGGFCAGPCKHRRKLDWVIVGAESGPNARPMNEDWVRSIRDQCQEANVPFFYKQKMDKVKKVAMPKLDGKIYSQIPNNSGV